MYEFTRYGINIFSHNTLLYEEHFGLNFLFDGSEDGLIHCFKESAPCARVLGLLKEALVVLNGQRNEQNSFGPSESDVKEASEPFHPPYSDVEDDNDMTSAYT